MSPKRYYTPVEANRVLKDIEPLVRALSERAGTLRFLRGRAQDPKSSRPAPETLVDPLYFRELTALHSDLQELGRRGCEVKDLHGGIVDFPALLEGREVCLCWRLGETLISHWHEVDAGFRGRQPIEAEHRFKEGIGSEP